MEFRRLENESDEELILRICQMKERLAVTWDEIANILNQLLDKSMTESAYRKKYQSYKKMLNASIKQCSDITDDKISNEILRLQKERNKIQTEKIELNKNIRELARDEMIIDRIHDAITTLPSFEKPEYIKPTHNNRSYLLTLSDQHFGIEFKVVDFYNNIINEYSPEIFKERMSLLFSKLLETIEKENIDEITIFELGDYIQGLLRLNSQLMQLRYGVIESALLYAEYMATWLNELSNYVRIKYSMVKNGNHDQLRLCGAPKNAFPDENMSYVIFSFLKERLKDNDNIIILDNPTGLNYAQMSGYICIGDHGETKNTAKYINDLSRTYQLPIDYLFTGHMHHSKQEEVGIDAEAITVKSIVGVDPYGKSINKTANAGANLFVFEQGNGKVCEYTYKLS